MSEKAECEIESLRQVIAIQRRYIGELERQLDPSVVEEIKAELDAQAQEEDGCP
jgi:hypothetical protein